MHELQVRRVNAEAAARAERAAELRVEGWAWDRIAAETGYQHGTHCRRAVLNYLGELPQPDRAAAHALWSARIEQLWSQAYADVQQQRPGAMRAAVSVVQRAAALSGLDAPTQLQVHTPTEAEYQGVLQRVLELDRQARGVPEALEADLFAPEYLDAEVVESGEADPFRTPGR